MLVYSGRAVAPVFDNAGGGAEYLCLPDQLDTGGLDQNNVAGRSTLVGVHFETFSDSNEFLAPGAQFNEEPFHAIDGNSVACAVCMSAGTAVMMIPNNQDCPVNDATTLWALQYTGFLMAARDYIFLNSNGQDLQQEPVFGNVPDDGIPPPHFRTQYVCVDGTPTNIGGNSNTEALMSHIRILCRGFVGLDLISCLEYFDEVADDDNCEEDDLHCALGPLGCAVCTAAPNSGLPTG